MIINTNMASLNAQRNLNISNNAIQKSLEKLSSGYRINRAADDAAGLAISEKMRSQINGLNQASQNAQNGISLIQTAEGALNETHSILQRMRELAVQSSTGTNTSGDRLKIQDEIKQLQAEITRIGNTTQFNGMTLLNGAYSGGTAGALSGIVFQIGANAGQTIAVKISDMRASALGSGITSADLTGLSGTYAVSGTYSGKTVENISLSGSSGASIAIVVLDKAISQVSEQRSNLGAVQNRLEHTIANLNVASENLTSSEANIRDVDMAQEMSNFTKNQILSQAGTAMLAQANQNPQSILKLLQ